MRFVALACAVTLLAACEKAVENNQQAAANKAGDASEVASTTVAASAAKPLSKDAALKLMHDRHENMEEIGDAVKAARRQINAASPDIGEVRASAATIARLAPHVPSWFPAGTGPDVGKTEALPAIWEKPQDFAVKARDFQKAALAFDAAAKSGDVARIKTSFGDLGKTCKSCHDPYREEH